MNFDIQFVIPNKPEDLLETSSDDKYQITDFFNAAELDETEQSKRLDEVIQILFSEEPGEAGTIENVFQELYCFIYALEETSKEIQEQVMDILYGSLQNFNDAHEFSMPYNELKMYLFLVYFFITKVKSTTKGIDILKILKIVQTVLKREDLEADILSLAMEMGFAALPHKKRQTEIYHIWNSVVTRLNEDGITTWRTKIVHLLYREDAGLITLLTDIVRIHPELVVELVRELGKTLADVTASQEESQGVRNVSNFLEKLAQVIPKQFLTNLSVLIPLLDNPSYILRCGIIQSLGHLLVFLIKEDQSHNAETETYGNYREQLLHLLCTRIYDKAIYCRAKVLEVFKILSEEDCLPHPSYITILKLASGRLKDLGAIVRKKACNLKESLVYRSKFILVDQIGFETVDEIKDCKKQQQEKLDVMQQAKDGNFELADLIPGLRDMDTEQIDVFIAKEKMMIHYCDEYLEMLSILAEDTNILYMLIESTSVNDVTSAIDCLIAMHIRKLPAVEDLLSKILPLATKEANIRKSVIGAFEKLYLNMRTHTVEDISANLVTVVSKLDLGQISCFESIINELKHEKAVPNEIVKQLWKDFSGSNAPSKEQLMLLRFMADKNDLNRKYETICSMSLQGDWPLISEGLKLTLLRGIKDSRTEMYLDQAAVKILNQRDRQNSWFRAAEQLIRTATDVSTNPLDFFKKSTLAIIEPLYAEGGVDEHTFAQSIFVVSEIMIRFLIHIDWCKSEYKKKRFTEQNEGEEKDELEEITGGKNAQLLNELDTITSLQETQITHGDGFLACITPLIVQAFTNITTTNYEPLMKSAIIAMGKLMIISQSFCETYLEAMLKTVSDPDIKVAVRCNGLIALGDIAQRHPNLFEPNSEHLFALLRDKELRVRKRTLLIVTHLVLNDMLKIKGQIGDVLHCLVDNSMKSTASTFLHELNSKDNNIIINLIPDAISRLVNSDHDTFRTLMGKMFGYVLKERHFAPLIDKLCDRLHIMENETEWENIAFCLGSLNYNEKTTRKLLENQGSWTEKVLRNQKVKEYFDGILVKAKKSWKNDNRALLDELESRLNGYVSNTQLNAEEAPPKTQVQPRRRRRRA